MQIDAHVGGVNDLAFSTPKQLCVITCGDDKTIKVCFEFKGLIALEAKYSAIAYSCFCF